MLASARAQRRLHLAVRRVSFAVVRRLPLAVVDAVRRPVAAPAGSLRGRAHKLLIEGLRRGGIPAAAPTFTLLDNRELSFVNADSLVLQQLYWFGEQGWEPALLPWWRYFCGRSTAILELGANVGYFTVQGARVAPHARYVAVEPHPASVQVCRANLALNGVRSVHVVAAAAVAEPGVASVSLVIPWEQLATPTVAFVAAGSELPPAMSQRASAVTDVPAVDVRTLLADVDLIKIDVEGQEHALLATAWDHLRTRRPTVFVEVLPGTSRLRALITQLCEDLGYHCYVPHRDRLVRLEPARIATVVLRDEYGGHDVILSADPDLRGPSGTPGGVDPGGRTA